VVAAEVSMMDWLVMSDAVSEEVHALDSIVDVGAYSAWITC
jgi:hypothetical protein